MITDIIEIDAKTLATASKDTTLRIWEISTGWCQSTLTGHSREITRLLFIEELDVLVSGSLDATVRVWDRKKKVCERVIEN